MTVVGLADGRDTCQRTGIVGGYGGRPLRKAFVDGLEPDESLCERKLVEKAVVLRGGEETDVGEARCISAHVGRVTELRFKRGKLALVFFQHGRRSARPACDARLQQRAELGDIGRGEGVGDVRQAR